MDDAPDAGPISESDAASVVLARKHRPQTFDALIGQDALVRVLSNAFERDKIPHAMILTGVRGVGKTTTARIVAKGLNCLAADRPTIQPCGVCEACRSIAASRHVDVLEMDAASRTGVDDIREIIESVRYRAAAARYKVYIIDETHMLSKSAFNALLKTLEEPPPHVVFILATTDIHKVPVTVLSRCMRFDLRRVDPEEMAAHLRRVVELESADASDEALRLIARASEGSVRDALSLLDQALAHGGGAADASDVRDMLGLAARDRIFALFELIMRGAVVEALDALAALHQDGADPVSVLRELAEACHLTTLARAAPSHIERSALSMTEREAAGAAAEAYSVRALSRAWQMLLKAIEEASQAPSSLAAAEMAVIRMAHVAELPSPEEIARALTQESGAADAAAPAPPPRNDGPSTGGGPTAQAAVEASGGRTAIRLAASQAEAIAPAPDARPAPAAEEGPHDIDGVAALIRARRDAKLLIALEKHARPGVVRPGFIEFTPTDDAPKDLAAELGRKLTAWTGRRWIASVAPGHDAPTLDERRQAAADDLRARAEAHPLVRTALTVFQGAELKAVRDLTRADAAAFDDGAPPYDDDDGFAAIEEWDGSWEPDLEG